MDLAVVDEGGKGEGEKELYQVWVAYIPLCLPLPHLNKPFSWDLPGQTRLENIRPHHIHALLLSFKRPGVEEAV